jgi:hypothetical protein
LSEAVHTIIARSVSSEAIQPSPLAARWIASLTLAMTLVQRGLPLDS